MHLSVDWHLFCFHFGATLNNTAVNICIQGFFKHMFSILLDGMCRSGIAGPHDSTMFNILRNYPTNFLSGYSSSLLLKCENVETFSLTLAIVCHINFS